MIGCGAIFCSKNYIISVSVGCPILPQENYTRLRIIEGLLLMLDIDPDGTLASDIKSAMVCDPEVLALNGGKPIMRKPHYHPRGFFACPELFK